MKNKNIMHITAVTEVTPVGQKCLEVVVEYKEAIDENSLDCETYAVKDRNIKGVTVAGNEVHIRLDENDEKAMTYHPGMPWQGKEAYLEEAAVSLVQVKDIKTAAGNIIEAFEEEDDSDKSFDALADLFIQGSYGKTKYNLFVPRNYDPGKKYPLIQFIHDASACGEDTRLAITQGLGALVWVGEEEQAKHECFVYAPQFSGSPIVDDDWNVSPKLEDAKAALDNIIETYSIDKNRIYTTGQSMGCMSSIVLNVRYPDFFAASFLVAGQWDDRAIAGLEKQRLWMLCSQGDAKAFPIMNQMGVRMEEAGAKIARRVMENGLSQEEYYKIKEEVTRDNPNVIYTPYKLETVADGWSSNGGMHHVSTWKTAYSINAIHDWLFEQKRG